MKRKIRNGDNVFYEQEHAAQSMGLVSFTIGEDTADWWELSSDDADYMEVTVSREGLLRIEGTWPPALLSVILRRAVKWIESDGRPAKVVRR